jgi:hypothetical protein
MSLRDFISDRKFVVTGGALFLALGLFVFFPSTARLSAGTQSLIALLIFFFAFPLLYVRYVLHESWQELGFRMEQTLADWMRVCLALLSGWALFFCLYQWWPSLHEAYRLPFAVERSFFSFVRYEVFILGTLFFYEVFFRGFVMLVFLRRFGVSAIFWQTGVFLLFLAGSASLDMSQMVMILFAPLSGFVAYRSRSIWYSFCAIGLFFLTVDIFLLIANR